jgi:tRNA A-37 threonylcarbamoyl transferase component Bud32/tetratricopeptide (TPR) repeat protein
MNTFPSVPVNGDGNLLGRGAVIGRFQVVGLVGKGGMGEVYAAYDPELDRHVAIKLLRAGRNTDSDEGRTRMMREAQAIARVSHPNVVVVYDAGTYEDRIFIAMEFVEGHTLGYWMHAQTRTWPEVLEVFTAAGRGLAAAHERELVHRDFKPDNVMIGDDGQVRVMDFGLVQLASDRARDDGDGVVYEEAPGPETEPTKPEDLMSTRPIVRMKTPPRGIARTPGQDRINPSLTRLGASLGTPAYMSPEQFRSEPTDAATDQFSFCIALYEALYGERPFTGRDYDDLGNNVASGFVRSAPKEKQIPLWIREILLRGLKVKPADRWPSMTALLAQLEQQPAVTSRRRFVAAAAAKLAGVWEAPRGDRPQDTPARAEIRRAFLATGKTYAKKAFSGTSQILDRYARRWSDLYVETCEATHVRNEQSSEVLDLRMGCLQEGLEDLKALCRMFRQATPEVVENAINAANALRGLDRCENIELLRAVVRPPEVAATREAVARLRVELAEVRALFRVGRLNDALKAVGPLQDEARELGYAPLLADVLISVATVYSEKGMADDGARVFEEALWAALRCRHDETAAEAATFLVYQAGSVLSQLAAAEIWSRLAETLLERMGGHQLIWGWLLTNRSALRQIEGKPAEALEAARHAVTAKEKFLGPTHPDLAYSLNNVALCLDGLGETVQAVEHLARALRIVENELGTDHPRTGWMLSNYSELLNRVERFAEAGEAATRALTIFERETDPLGIFVTYPLVALGTSELGLGRFAHALPVLERANDIRHTKEPSTARRAEARFILARALWASGQDRERARSLAITARDEYRLSPDTPARSRELAETEDWLATRAKIS